MSDSNRRVLVIDDQAPILEDFRKILGGEGESEGLQDARSAFFGDDDATPKVGLEFDLTTASQGQEGVDLQQAALEAGAPFAMAFVDMRMPPGLDGMQTIKCLWQQDDRLQVVICTAFSDYSLEDIIEHLGSTDRLLILKKPFDPVEVRQLAGAMTEKWNVSEREQEQMEDLRRAEARAQVANKTKSEFLANMSHEIRTPMNAVLGYVDLLSDPNITPEEQAGYTATLRRSGNHLLTILDDILDISRIEASRLVINAADFCPFELAREVGSIMLPQAAAKDLGLRIEASEPIPGVLESDHVRVRQILLNLVGNAIKFTKQGSVKIVIHLDEHPEVTERYLHFDVADTGIGIAPEKRAAIFEAFSQGDTSTTRAAGGTGLGLAISKRLALLLGGDIEVESEMGSGSVFSLRLHAGPLRPAALVTYSPEEIGLEPVPASAGADEGHADEGLTFDGRVLLVEDVKFNQVLFTAFLRKAGAEVVVASNGQIGVDKALEAEMAGEPFDVVLMDMQMPVLDGYEATRKLRAAGYQQPIIALTAHAMSEDRDKCLTAGCTDYVTKPVDRAVLLTLCSRVVSQHRTPAPLPSETGDVRDPSRHS